MKIRFDCADNCRHKDVCKYFNTTNDLDKSLKSIYREGYDYVTIHIKCKHYVGTWGGGIRDGK